jgi:signal transduction histidine kinase
VLGALLAATAAGVSLANADLDGRGFLATVGAGTIAVLIGVGLFAWQRQTSRRFGQLLVLAGFGSFLAALGASDDQLVYSIGRVAGWLFEVMLVYLFLSYPSGRLTARPERIVLAMFAATTLMLYLPSALLIDEYPLPWLTCTAECPGNALQVVGSEPGFLETFFFPVRTLITFASYVALLVILLRRIRSATTPTSLGLTPVFAAVAFRASMVVCFLTAREADASDGFIELLAALVMISTPVAALGFLVGLLRWQIHSAAALRRLAESPEPSTRRLLRELVREALEDPSLDILYDAPGEAERWHDARGAPATLPSTRDRCVIEIDDHGSPIAAIVCDGALNEHRELVEAAGSWVRAVLVRQRLVAALNASLRDVEASGRRLAAAAASERRRIERDLHDGAQQQLVTLRVKLQLAEEQLEHDPVKGAQLLRELAPRIDEVIDEVRSLARGIYPALLADAGLGEAVRAAGMRAELPVTVSVDGLRRYPLEVENAVYFCCLEALQNAAKHGRASNVAVEFHDEDGELRFEVRDDGHGFASGLGNGHSGAGAGLTNMRDRLVAVGGTLVVRSAPGSGTSVSGSVPVRPA